DCNCINIWIIGNAEASSRCPEQVAKCNFQQFLNRCNLSDLKNIKEDKLNYNDMQVIGIISNFIILFTNPFVCFIGLITNLTNLYIIKKIKTEFKEQLYTLMNVNTNVCLVYFLINIVRMFNFCFLPNGDYCLNISKVKFVQYFDIIVNDLIGSILKTLSNVLIILIGITRLKTLKYGSNYKLLKKKIKWLILFITFVLCALNLEKILNSYVNVNFFPIHDVDYLGFPIKNSFQSWDYLSYNLNQDSEIFYRSNIYLLTLFILNFSINTVLLFVIMGITDLIVLIKFRQDLYSVLQNKHKLSGMSYWLLSDICNFNPVIAAVNLPVNDPELY
ncbi:unnamed protein product, partial [Brachionus calyciflorus]